MHENEPLLARTVPLKSYLALKSHLSLKSHLFPKRLGLAHALGVQGDAEAFKYAPASRSPDSPECVE
jgi:hypothetical protein